MTAYKMIESLKMLIYEVSRSGPVLQQFVRQYLVLRYRRTVLGYFWTLINPLMMMTVTAVVFATLFKIDLKTYAVFLFSGMIPWNCFAAIVVQSGGSLIMNEGLIKKIYLPRVLFPLSLSVGILIDSVLSFLALFVIILCIGGTISWSLLFVPFAYILLFVFAFGIGLMTSVATVFFRDLQHVLVIVMQAWFFLTPVMYKSEALAGKVAILITLNPVVPFIELFRSPLSLGVLPSMNAVILCTIFALVSLAVGLMVFLWKEKQVVYRL